jgi:hypothetical protein
VASNFDIKGREAVTEHKAFQVERIQFSESSWHPAKWGHCRPNLEEYLDERYGGLWMIDFDERCDYGRAWLSSGDFVELIPDPVAGALFEVAYRGGEEAARCSHHLNRWGLYDHWRGHAHWRRLVRPEQLPEFHAERLALWQKIETNEKIEVIHEIKNSPTEEIRSLPGQQADGCGL